MAYQFKTVPYEHQLECLHRMRDRPGFGLFMEMGTGKTKVSIDEIGMDFDEGKIDGALVLAPKGVYMNWARREIPAHMPDSILARAKIVEWRPGGGSVSHQRELRALLSWDGLAILVMNTEALSSGKVAWSFATKFLQARKRVSMYVDESTQIKNPGSQRTKVVVKLGRAATKRRIMTGYPVPRSPLDFYSQFDFLGDSILGFSSFYSFRSRYAIMKDQHFGNRRVKLIVGYQNLPDLTARVAPLSYRVTKDECLDLPPKIYSTRDVELTDEQWQAYTRIRDDALMMLDETTTISVDAVITQLLRLQQIVCGHIVDDDGMEHDIPSRRIDDLMELVEEFEGKTIIWSRFRRDITKMSVALSKAHGDVVVEYHGGTQPDAREEAIRRFQDGDARFFISTPQTGGYGLTLTAAKTVIYYSNDYDLEKRLQSEDRPHRAGLDHHVNYIDMVARGTTDEKLISALRGKMDVGSLIMGDGYRQWIV